MRWGYERAMRYEVSAMSYGLRALRPHHDSRRLCSALIAQGFWLIALSP